MDNFSFSDYWKWLLAVVHQDIFLSFDHFLSKRQKIRTAIQSALNHDWKPKKKVILKTQ